MITVKVGKSQFSLKYIFKMSQLFNSGTFLKIPRPTLRIGQEIGRNMTDQRVIGKMMKNWLSPVWSKHFDDFEIGLMCSVTQEGYHQQNMAAYFVLLGRTFGCIVLLCNRWTQTSYIFEKYFVWQCFEFVYENG